MDQGVSQVFRHALGPVGQPSWPVALLFWEALAGLAIGLLLVLGFAAHLAGGLAGPSWRLSCLAYAVLCLIRGVDWRQAGAQAMLWLPFLLGAAIDAAVLHGMASVADVARQLFIFGFAAIVFGAARDPVARRVGAYVLIVAAGAILAYTLVQTLPTLSSGWSYATARTLKAKSFQSGFNANEVCFAALVALLAGYREALVPRWISLAMLALLGVCSVLLGARTPAMAMLVGAGAGVVIVHAPIWAACARHRWLGTAAVALVTGGVLVLFFSHIDAIAYSTFARQLAGRAALWQIAADAWSQEPLFGFGPGTFRDVIHANLGKAHFSGVDEFASLYALHAGGFHNIWLSVLVERGALGLAGLFASWCLLVGFGLSHGGKLVRARRFVLFTLLISLFLRGQVELAGLFDDGDGPINQILMMALGLTLPRYAPVLGPSTFQARDLAALAAAETESACT